MRGSWCGTGLKEHELSDHDREEFTKFKQLLSVEKARKDGGDPSACDMLEAMIYPEGIGRTESKGDA